MNYRHGDGRVDMSDGGDDGDCGNGTPTKLVTNGVQRGVWPS